MGGRTARHGAVGHQALAVGGGALVGDVRRQLKPNLVAAPALTRESCQHGVAIVHKLELAVVATAR